MMQPPPDSPRPILTVHFSGGATRLEVSPGLSVRDALDATGLRVRAACGGTGSCGACAVKLLSGEVNPPTVAEFMKLPAEERAEGWRLACQLRLRGDAGIHLKDPAPPSPWRSIPAEALAPPPGCLPDLTRSVFGLAVDLGTTHIRIALWDRKKGRRIATRRGPNPQGIHGADILNRLASAHGRPERAEELARLARSAILQALRDLLARDVGEVKPMLAEIGRVLIVGNSAMLALLTGQGGEALFDPESWQRPIDILPADPLAWKASWSMPNAEIVVPAPVAGFIGSDLLADVIATRLMEGPSGAMLLDVGTNTEIALWDGRILHVTSVPGGPAFEGGGIRNGMAAEAGAIHRVSDGPAGIRCQIMGDGEPRGFCGSGLVDGIAVLRRAGYLKPSGRFVVSPGVEGYPLIAGNPRTAIAGSDVDAFQRAKAATAAGMAELLHRAGLAWGDLRRLCICGAFGRQLDVANAQAVGLLPPIAPTLVELSADAALTGCERALLTPKGETLFDMSGRQVSPINLSLVADYETSYINHLRLLPVPASP